ncbi:aegerolysin type hemolysin [Nemania sp. NC0429]|nr:aegerolysin type hemolysin [Nemania sp. NC0429]
MVGVKGYGEWIEITVQNSLRNGILEIRNADTNWGKFHVPGDKGQTLTNAEIDRIFINPGMIVKICACGREDTPSGVTGIFNIYDDENYICMVHWDCPFVGANTFGTRDENLQAGYVVAASECPKHGPIGKVKVEIARIEMSNEEADGEAD